MGFSKNSKTEVNSSIGLFQQTRKYLEPIIQSEVSQKEKHQYNILTHIYGIQKDGNNNPVYETAKRH